MSLCSWKLRYLNYENIINLQQARSEEFQVQSHIMDFFFYS